jgi:hypothetical protein
MVHSKYLVVSTLAAVGQPVALKEPALAAAVTPLWLITPLDAVFEILVAIVEAVTVVQAGVVGQVGEANSHAIKTAAFAGCPISTANNTPIEARRFGINPSL